MDLSWLKGANEFGPVELEILYNFAQYTTMRILKNMQRLGVGEKYTGELERSIHSTVYSEANGNSAYVRFFYLNHATFTELAVGKYWSDKKGVKNSHLRPVTQIAGSGFGPIDTKVPKHRSKPFLHSEIRVQLQRAQMQLAAAAGFTASAYMRKVVVDSFERAHQRMKENGFLEITGVKVEDGDIEPTILMR